MTPPTTTRTHRQATSPHRGGRHFLANNLILSWRRSPRLQAVVGFKYGFHYWGLGMIESGSFRLSAVPGVAKNSGTIRRRTAGAGREPGRTLLRSARAFDRTRPRSQVAPVVHSVPSFESPYIVFGVLLQISFGAFECPIRRHRPRNRDGFHLLPRRYTSR